ncbi:acyl carrier protein [Micromonospora fluostatini]|uniref:acyl carrier protein n=1 Tax=Micromonospora sp. JCM 30529 TaxID=3421643 RepID=UPI003D17C2D1
MTDRQFTVDDLHRILVEGAGETEGGALGPDTIDTTFDELGYESIALLETGSRIEREFGVSLSDEDVMDSRTPRGLIEAVNTRLGTTSGAAV